LPESSSNLVVPLPAYGYRVISGPQVSPTANVYAKVIGDGVNATCYVTPGEGL
jgi:hypothetical protein